jgi:hypothetical protein
MPGLQIIITKAGRAALVNAEHNGTAPLKITEIGITAAVFTANEDTNALPGEIKRIKTISGEVVAPDTMHVTIRDDGTDTYTMRGIGYWLSNGVLLGVYSQPDPILQKSTQSMMLLAADVVFANIKATSLTFGDANFTNPPATVDRQGVVELATVEETKAGKDGVRAVTPAALAPAMDQAIANHRADADPHKQYLTSDRANALYFRRLPAVTNSDTDCDTLLETGVRDVSVANDRGIVAATHLPVGGDGYGTLTTVNGGQFVRQRYSEGGTTRRTWERTGYLDSTPPFFGRAWKLLWDSVTFDPTSKQNTLGFTPVQQGTGIAQTQNIVKIGWSDGKGLKATVDASDQGSFVFGDRAMRLNWRGLAGQPEWLFGGAYADDVNVYNPSNFRVNYADSAGGAQAAEKISNGISYMRLNWGDPGGQTAWLWGSDDPTSARLMTTSQLRVGYAAGAGVATNAAAADMVLSKDTRDTNFAPQDTICGATFAMQGNQSDGLTDGGNYHGVMNFRPWGIGADFTGGYAHQLGFTENDNIWHRSGKNAEWRGWSKLWHSGNFNPAAKQDTLGYSPVQQGTGIGQIPNTVKIGWSNGSGVKVTVDATDMGSVVFGIQSIRLNWSGFGGQPPWLFGGTSPGDVNVYNPSNFSVNYANSAGYATGAGNADKVGNVSMRFQENPGAQPYYVYGCEPGRVEMSLYNRGSLAVGFANQLTGPGLQDGSIGSYRLNKNYTAPEAGGAWELRGYAYDFGSGGDGGIGSRTALWQRVA